MHPKAIILMGVSGCGKTTIGRGLSKELGWKFYEGDDFHFKKNIEKMSQGIPLMDEDRAPWLRALREVIDRDLGRGKPLILACSALKRYYRDLLGSEDKGVMFVFLKGEHPLILERMTRRARHYMKAEMLKSQFDALEEPEAGEALVVDISPDPQTITNTILAEIAQERTRSDIFRLKQSKAAPDVVKALARHAEGRSAVGITATASGFFGPQGREIPGIGITVPRLQEHLATLNVGGHKIVNFEMESSLLFHLARQMGYRAGAICPIIANRPKGTFLADYGEAVERTIKTGLDAMLELHKAQR